MKNYIKILLFACLVAGNYIWATDDGSNVDNCDWECKSVQLFNGGSTAADETICLGESFQSAEDKASGDSTVSPSGTEYKECINEDGDVVDTDTDPSLDKSDLDWSYGSTTPDSVKDEGGEHTITLIGSYSSGSECDDSVSYTFTLGVIELDKIEVYTETAASIDATTTKGGAVGEANTTLEDNNGSVERRIYLDAYATDEIDFKQGEPTWELTAKPNGAGGLTNSTGDQISYLATVAGQYKFKATACGESLEIIVNVDEDLEIEADKEDVYRKDTITFSATSDTSNPQDTEWQWRPKGGAWQNGPAGETFELSDKAAGFYEVKGKIGDSESDPVEVRFCKPTGVGYGNCVNGDGTVDVPDKNDIVWSPAGDEPDGITAIKTYRGSKELTKHETKYTGPITFRPDFVEADKVSYNTTYIYWNGESIEEEFDVMAVNENAKVELEVAVSSHALTMGDKIAEITGNLSDLRVGNIFNVSLCQWVLLGQDGNGPVSGELALDKFSGNLKFGQYKKCCNDEIGGMEILTGGANFEIVAGRCDFPFYGVPKLASVNLRLQAAFTLGMTLSDLTWVLGSSAIQDCPYDAVADVSLGVSLGGGLSATVLGGAVIDASAVIIGNASGKVATYDLEQGNFDWGDGKIKGKWDGVFQITLLSFMTFSKTVPIVPERTLFQL